MKKTIIGLGLMVNGVLATIGIIIAAAIYAPNINEWVGSKLWFAIFGANSEDLAQSLNMGVPFIIGIVFIVTGLIIVVNEYVKKD